MKIRSTAPQGDCHNHDFQMIIAGYHYIGKTEFDNRIQQYDPSLTTGKKFTRADVENIMSGKDCALWHLEVGPPGVGEGTPGTNQDIMLNSAQTLSKLYSFALFQGIIAYYSPDNFYFYKSRKSPADFDIVFTVEKAGAIVYWGDVSDLPTRS